MLTITSSFFFQIKCNECIYGEIYPKELETIMDKVSLYDWFERLARVIKYLMRLRRHQRAVLPILSSQHAVVGTLRRLPGITWRTAGMTSNHHAHYDLGYTRATMA